jgi:L,D-transpeptidase YbiS
MSQESIVVDSATQTLHLLSDQLGNKIYSISTAKNGLGEQMGSECTPRGKHYIRAKVGFGCDSNAVFCSRRPTGERYVFDAMSALNRDWILGRILWLSGLEKGVNRCGRVDTMRRYIYIHGSPDHLLTGVPGSRGCIRMRAADIVELFDRVTVGCNVLIT